MAYLRHWTDDCGYVPDYDGFCCEKIIKESHAASYMFKIDNAMKFQDACAWINFVI